MVAGLASLAYMWPENRPVHIPVPEFEDARAYAHQRVNAYTPMWVANMPQTMAGKGALLKLQREFRGDLHALRWYLVRKSPQGHFGWEKEALEAFEGSIFQTPTCAPSAFPGAIGYGKNTLRCAIRQTPYYRPVTNFDHRGLSNGAIGAACDAPGDSIGMQSTGWYCELSGDHPDSAGFRLVMPEVVGTRGINAYGNGIRLETSKSDSLIWIGRPMGGASGDRYDLRVPSFLTSGSQGQINIQAKHIIWAHTTAWDEQCSGTSCSPNEQKQWRCDTSEGGDSVYVVHSDFIGNSGDDVATLGCSYSTWARNFVGPVQSGGGQTSCMTGGSDGTATEITFADGGCFQAGHRTPLANQRRVEMVNWVVTGWDSRNMEFSGTECCTETNLRSVLYMSGKVTNGDKEDTWFLFRVHALHASANTLLGEYAADSGYYALNYNKLGIDTVPNDGSFDIHLSTISGEGPSAISLWNSSERAAVCDRTSALGGDTSFPCTDTAGRSIDSLTFKADTTLHTSDYSRVLDPSDIYSEIIQGKKVGNRFRIGCDGSLQDSLDHNVFVDSILSSQANDSWHSGVPGSFPDSMQVWHEDYPTGTGMAADSSATSYTPCPKNSHGVPTAMASTLVSLYGGNAANVDWSWDDANTGYELWRWLIQPDSLDAVLLSGEAESQVTTGAVHREAVGDGAAAFSACWDSLLVGGDGVASNGDEWPLHITELNYNSTGDGSLKAWMEDTVTSDLKTVHVGAWTVGGETSSSVSDPQGGSRCIWLTGKTAQGGGAQVENNGSWDIREDQDNARWYLGYFRAYVKTGGIYIQDIDSLYTEHVTMGLGGTTAGTTVGLTASGDTLNGNEGLTRWITEAHNLRYWGSPRLSRWGAGPPRSQPPSNHYTIARTVHFGPGHRIPLAGGDTMRFYQGVTYNPTTRPLEATNQRRVDFIQWEMKRGPGAYSGAAPDDAFLLVNDSTSNTNEGGDSIFTLDDSHYVSQIKFGANSTIATDPDSLWAGSKAIIFCWTVSGSADCASDGDPAPSRYKSSTALPLHSEFPVDTAVTFGDSLIAHIVAKAGYSQALDSLGNLRTIRSAFDSARVTEYNDSTGQSVDPDGDTINVPTPATGTACRDDDGDLMCDAWEDANGLDSGDADDAAEDPDGDGVPNWWEWHGTPSGGSTNPQVADQAWIGFGEVEAPDPPEGVDYTFIIENDTLAVMWLPLDSLFGTLWVDTALVPLSATPFICSQADPTSNDSALVRVYLGDENGNAVYDSTEVDSILSNHGPFEGCTITTLRQLN